MQVETININKYLNEYNYEEIEQSERIPGKFNTDFNFPLDKWKIIQHKYKSSTENEHYWNICSYDILKYDEDSSNFKEYMSFGRDYHSLDDSMIAYTIQNNKEFIITSSQYMSLTVLNLTDKIIKSYVYGNSESSGFCPISIEYFQDNNNNLNNELKVYGCFWGAPYETIIIKNVNLNDLTETYSLDNNDILIIPDDSDEYDPWSLIDDKDLKEKIEQKDLISDLEMSVAIELIQNDDFDKIPIQFKEDFKIVILKSLLYYADNEM